LEISKIESMPMRDYPFDLRTKVKLLMVANAEEEYIISAGVSFGLRVGDFLQITRGQLEPLLSREPPISMGKLTTQKEGESAYPYIDKDCKFAIKRLLEQMDREGRKGKDEHMLQMDKRGINTRLGRLFKKARIPLGIYRIRFHILRKFISDSLASVSASDKWKLIIGKSSKSPYVSSECLEAYKRVLPLTQVDGSQAVRTSSEEMEELRLENTRLKLALQTLVKTLGTKGTQGTQGTKIFPPSSKGDSIFPLIPEATKEEVEELLEYLFGVSRKKRERES